MLLILMQVDSSQGNATVMEVFLAVERPIAVIASPSCTDRKIKKSYILGFCPAYMELMKAKSYGLTCGKCGLIFTNMSNKNNCGQT